MENKIIIVKIIIMIIIIIGYTKPSTQSNKHYVWDQNTKKCSFQNENKARLNDWIFFWSSNPTRRTESSETRDAHRAGRTRTQISSALTVSVMAAWKSVTRSNSTNRIGEGASLTGEARCLTRGVLVGARAAASGDSIHTHAARLTLTLCDITYEHTNKENGQKLI